MGYPQRFQVDPGMERTAEFLIERLGINAFDFATQQAELLADTGAHASVSHWRTIGRAIEELLRERASRRLH